MDPQNTTGSHGQQSRPPYDTAHGGHYGASQALSAQGFAPSELYTGTWANVHQGLTGSYKDILTAYWQQTIQHLESDNHDYKLHQLPLARIKKVMKADPEVKMISAEAPILFAKGCDIFITELTMRAWIHAEENKRRTLQRSDIASALSKSDMFDFLIDIVPREEASTHAKRTQASAQAQPTQPQMAAPNHGQHPMGADYAGMGGHAIAPDADYRQAQTMYPGQVQPGAPTPYGQPQGPMYNVEEMYGYGGMPPQQEPPVAHPNPHLLISRRDMPYVANDPGSLTAPWNSDEITGEIGGLQRAMAAYSMPIPQEPVIKEKQTDEEEPENNPAKFHLPQDFFTERELSESPTLRLGEKRRKSGRMV
ncbi:hypothetical protein OQA88_121 [Cercophora sp. LCS_1]